MGIETKKGRIVLIDALRGLAIAGILIIHHIEHFDFYKKPDYILDWLVKTDQWVWDKVFMLVSGKAFALFSLLFGISFWIIHENRKAKGESYLLRHFWRMFLLLLIGAIHIVFFRGDILAMYAILGLPLVITPYLNKKVLLILSAVLLLNPIGIYSIITYALGTPFDFRLPYPQVDINNFLSEGNFIDMVQVNFTSGYLSTLVWSWNVGRFFTIPGLFFLGTYFGKTKALTHKSLKFWYKVITISLIGWLFFNLIEFVWIQQIENASDKRLIGAAIAVYSKLCIMFGTLSLIVIFWRHNNGKLWIARFANFGRMGLTNYVLMSIIGASLYYGWGLGLYKYLGSLATLGVAIVVLVLQMKFSTWWLQKYGQGPLERLWRKLTWLQF